MSVNVSFSHRGKVTLDEKDLENVVCFYCKQKFRLQKDKTAMCQLYTKYNIEKIEAQVHQAAGLNNITHTF